MREDHNGNSYVTWRDLRESVRDYTAELDRRFGVHTQQHDDIGVHLQRAVELAAENLRIKLLEENQIRAQILEERALLVTKTWVEAEFAKLQASMEADLERQVSSLSSRVSSVAGTTGEAAHDINNLQELNTARKSRELGWRGALLAAAVVIITTAANIVFRVFFD